MKKRMAALLGGAAVLVTLNVAQAAMPVPQSQPVKALMAANAASAQGQVELVRDRRRRGWRHGRRHRRDGYWPGAAFGAVIGGMLAAQPRYYGRQAYGSAVSWCMRRYRSYDPYSRTYLGYDGYRHSCP
jgi:uncharacterized protein YcfJ